MTTKSLVYGTETSLVDAIAKSLTITAHYFKQRRNYREVVRQLSAMTPRQLDDLGVSPWEIEKTAHEAVYGIH